MTTDSFFAVAVAAVIALFFGAVVAFAGYRFFLVLLPIWGFFFGFGLGAQTIQALFGEGFLSTITSWAVGFGVAVVFAGLSYLFYFIGVGLLENLEANRVELTYLAMLFVFLFLAIRLRSIIRSLLSLVPVSATSNAIHATTIAGDGLWRNSVFM